MNPLGSFPNRGRDDWEALTNSAPSSRDSFGELSHSALAGPARRPIYFAGDLDLLETVPGATPFVRGSTASGVATSGWDLRQLHSASDPEVNREILNDLAGGVTSIELQCVSPSQLRPALADVALELAPIALEPGAAFVSAAAALTELWQQQGVDRSQARGALNADPLSALARHGHLQQGIERALRELADLATSTAQEWPLVTAARIDTGVYHDAGATDAQDLAYSMSSAVCYLRAMVAGGMPMEPALRQLLFCYSLDSDFFAGIVKLRAARRLFARVAEACLEHAATGPAPSTDTAQREPGAMKLQACTGRRILSRSDPQMNLLRITATAFAGAIGGAEIVTAAPFDVGLAVPSHLGRRLARNTQLILREESHLHRVLDPAGGSWFLESATQELAAEGWRRFQAIEEAGGMVTALRSGTVQREVSEVAAQRAERIAQRRAVLVGVNDFANPDEPPIATPRRPTNLGPTNLGPMTQSPMTLGGADRASLTDSKSPAITPLTACPLAEPFDNLRAQAENYRQRYGAKPRVFLAKLGRPHDYHVPARFAASLFAAAGIEPRGSGAYDQVETCAAAFKESGAGIAVLCSSDEIYSSLAGVVSALRRAGAHTVYLTTSDGPDDSATDRAPELNVDRVLQPGVDVADVLRDTFDRLVRAAAPSSKNDSTNRHPPQQPVGTTQVGETSR